MANLIEKYKEILNPFKKKLSDNPIVKGNTGVTRQQFTNNASNNLNLMRDRVQTNVQQGGGVGNILKQNALASLPGTQQYKQSQVDFANNPYTQKYGLATGQFLQKHPNIAAGVYGMNESGLNSLINRLVLGDKDRQVAQAPQTDAQKRIALLTQGAGDLPIMLPLGGGSLPLALTRQGTSGALGAGINKLVGGDTYEGASAGLKIAPFAAATGGLINKGALNIAGRSLNPVTQQIAGRSVAGALGVPEGMLLAKTMDRPYTASDIPIDIGLNALLGTSGTAKAGVKKTIKNSAEAEALKDHIKTLFKKMESQDAMGQKQASKRTWKAIKDAYKEFKRVGGKGSPLGVQEGGEMLSKVDTPKKPVDVYKEMLGGDGTTLTKPRTDLTGMQLEKQNKDLKAYLQKPSDVINNARQEISTAAKSKEPIKTRIGKFVDKTITDWENRFYPIEKLEGKIQKETKSTLLDQPSLKIKKLLGAGGAAERRHRQTLDPIIAKLGDDVDPRDLDVFMKAQRDIELSGRSIKGSDSKLASDRLSALKSQYGDEVYQRMESVAKDLYGYQSEGLKRLRDAGFISDEGYQAISTANRKYVPFQRVMDDVDGYLGVSGKTLQNPSQPVQKIKGSDREIYSPLESIIANTYKIENAIAKNNVAKSIAGLGKIDSSYSSLIRKVSNSNPNTISVWENGKKVFYEVPEDISQVVKGLNEEPMNAIVQILSAPSRMFRQQVTGRNLEFMIPNVFRDQFDAAVNSKYGYRPFIDYFDGLRHLVNYKYKGGDDLVAKWIDSGGKQFFEQLSGRKDVAKQIADAKEQKRAVKKVFEWVIGGIDTVGEFSETPTRIGLFKRALQKTGNVELAMKESREATLDFARMGAKMKVVNSIIPFSNVSVQGFSRMVRTAKGNPKKMAVLLTAYAGAPALAISLYNNRYHKDEYANVPDFEKEGNFIIMTGGLDSEGNPTYIKIPKGHIQQLVANPTDQLITWVADNNPKDFDALALSLLSGTLPLMSEGDSIPEIASRTIGSNIPQAVKPIVETTFNYDSFKNKPIVPAYMQYKPSNEQFFNTTPSAYQKFGDLTGASPLKAQHLAEGYFPASKQAGNIGLTLKGEATPNETYIARRFLGSYSGFDNERKTADKRKPNNILKPSDTASAMDIDKKEALKLYEKDIKVLSGYKQKKAEIENDLSLEDYEKEKKLATLDTNFRNALSRSGQLQEVTGKKESVQSAINKFKYGIDDYEKMQTGGLVSQKKKEDKAWTIAKSIFTDYDAGQLSVEQAGELIKQVGLKPVDVGYYVVATSDRDIRRAYVNSVMIEAAKNKQDVISALATLRKEVKGERVLSDTVIDDLYRDGYINATQKSYLKKVKDDGTGKVSTKGTGGKSSSKKLKNVELVKPKLGSKSYPKSTRRSTSYRGKYDTNYINKALGVDTSRLLSGLPLN